MEFVDNRGKGLVFNYCERDHPLSPPTSRALTATIKTMNYQKDNKHLLQNTNHQMDHIDC